MKNERTGSKDMFDTVFSNEAGELLESGQMTMLGRSGDQWLEPEPGEMIPLPEGASLVTVPGHVPVGVDAQGEVAILEKDPYQINGSAWAVAALLPQGFTRTLLPACVRVKSLPMPLLGYAAVGFRNGRVWVAAVQTDGHHKWHPRHYNTTRLPERIQHLLSRMPDNRIVRQLARCSLEYSCFTAQNLFYHRWEAGIPTTAACNACCLGCISEQHAGVSSPQSRLSFTPNWEEISELGLYHLESQRDPIISFGQGCEGEPSLNAPLISRAIRYMRQSNPHGTINMNTHGGNTDALEKLYNAGLDAIRVTIFSLLEKYYGMYHRPRNYQITDVFRSIQKALDGGIQVSLNLLVLPGFTDQEEQLDALLGFLKDHPIHMIQMRNLNIDPDFLLKQMDLPQATGLGMINFMTALQHEAGHIRLGSYTHPVVGR